MFASCTELFVQGHSNLYFQIYFQAAGHKDKFHVDQGNNVCSNDGGYSHSCMWLNLKHSSLEPEGQNYHHWMTFDFFLQKGHMCYIRAV